MKDKSIFIVIIIFTLIIASSTTLAQLTPEEQDKLKKRGLDFPEGSNIRIEGDNVILNQGSDVIVGSAFSGTIIGGSGGGRVTVQGTPILLMQDSVVRIENGKIVEMKNVNLEEEMSLEAHKVKGNLIDYENGKMTIKESAIIDETAINNHIFEQPVEIELRKDGSYRIIPKFTVASTEIDGKKIILGQDGEIILKNKEIIGFKNIDAFDKIRFRNWEIKGQGLIFNEDTNNLIFSNQIAIDEFNFFASLGQLTLNKENDRFSINRFTGGKIGQADSDGKIKRILFGGDYTFYKGKPLMLTVHGNSNFMDSIVGEEVYVRQISNKDTDFFIGGSFNDKFCEGLKDNCVEITREGIFTGNLRDKVDLSLSSLEKFPFRLVKLNKITDEDSVLRINNRKFSIEASSKGEAISSSELPEGLEAIVVQEDSGKVRIINHQGVKNIETGQLASFEEKVLERVLKDYDEKGHLETLITFVGNHL